MQEKVINHNTETKQNTEPEHSEMRQYFDDICGYEYEKEQLMYICDAMRFPEAYRKLGADLPKNLLLCGVPGVGKTLMAECLIRASGRPSFVCRKSDDEEDFIEKVNEIFESARAAAPSIILLDDMDKFAGDFFGEAAEFAAVQACIDDVKNDDVFVIATINDRDCLMESLIRPGRFDRFIFVDVPDEQSSAEIIERYFKDRKNISDDIDIGELTALTAGMTAVDIMTLANEAGVYAGYERSEQITMRHIVKAFVSRIDNIKRSNTSEETERMIACHEAGHAVMSELLEPGSVALLFAGEATSRSNGMMSRGRTGNIMTPDIHRKNALVALSGRAATELLLGRPDHGATSDLRKAYNDANKEVCDICVDGFEYANLNNSNMESTVRRNRRDMKTRSRMSEYYSEARRILSEHMPFLEKLAEELYEKGYLFSRDIREIREETEGRTRPGEIPVSAAVIDLAEIKGESYA